MINLMHQTSMNTSSTHLTVFRLERPRVSLAYIGVGSSSVKSSVKCTKSTNTITPKSYEYE